MSRTYDAVQQSGHIVATFLDESLTHVYGDRAVSVASSVCRDFTLRNALERAGVKGLDAYHVFTLFSNLLFVNRETTPDRLRELAPWFTLIGVDASNPLDDQYRRKLYDVAKSLRDIRNQVSHMSIGELQQVSSEDIVFGLSGTAKAVKEIGVIVEHVNRREVVFSDALLLSVRRLIDDCNAGVAEVHRPEPPEKTTQSTLLQGVQSTHIVVAAVVVFAVGLVAGLAWWSGENATVASNSTDDVIIVAFDTPPQAAVDSVLAAVSQSYAQASLDAPPETVVFRLISQVGVTPDSLRLPVALLGESTSSEKLARYLRDAIALTDPREAGPMMTLLKDLLTRSRESGRRVLLVTLGSTAREIDDTFIDDYNSEKWHATPRGFFEVWSSMRAKGLFLRPVFVYPKDPNVFDEALLTSYALEGYSATLITVPSWSRLFP